MVTKHGVPTSTELVRDDMAEYEDKPKPKPVPKEVVKRPNTQSARWAKQCYEFDISDFNIITAKYKHILKSL